MKKRNKHIGSSLEDFLKEEGVLEETRAVALKEALAWQVQQAQVLTSRGAAKIFLPKHTSRVSVWN